MAGMDMTSKSEHFQEHVKYALFAKFYFTKRQANSSDFEKKLMKFMSNHKIGDYTERLSVGLLKQLISEEEKDLETLLE